MIASKQQNSFVVDSRLFASKGQRILNYIIDLAVIYILVFAVALAVSFIEIICEVHFFSDRLQAITEFESYLVFFFFFFLYYLVMEFYAGRTLAKFVTGTVVVLKDGTKPRLYTIGIRTFFRIIPFDGISFLGSQGSGMHDTFSKTFVVKKTICERSLKSHLEFNELGS